MLLISQTRKLLDQELNILPKIVTNIRLPIIQRIMTAYDTMVDPDTNRVLYGNRTQYAMTVSYIWADIPRITNLDVPHIPKNNLFNIITNNRSRYLDWELALGAFLFHGTHVSYHSLSNYTCLGGPMSNLKAMLGAELYTKFCMTIRKMKTLERAYYAEEA